jgi:hypothetical protein
VALILSCRGKLKELLGSGLVCIPFEERAIEAKVALVQPGCLVQIALGFFDNQKKKKKKMLPSKICALAVLNVTETSCSWPLSRERKVWMARWFAHVDCYHQMISALCTLLSLLSLPLGISRICNFYLTRGAEQGSNSRWTVSSMAE